MLVIILIVLFFPSLLFAQTCNSQMQRTSPDSRFIIHDDGTVTDQKTGLMWMRCSLGQNWRGNNCTGDISTYPWATAIKQAKQVHFAGYKDWRLPSIKELASITELACYAPAINSKVFPNTQSGFYWSATPHANNSGYAFGVAWGVYFDDGDGNLNDKADSYGVRVVRSGQ